MKLKIDFENPIKNIIFDLGGVIVNIDYNRTLDEFRKLGFKGIDNLFTQFNQTDIFDKFDKGLVTPSEFRTIIKQLAGINCTDEQFDFAWNAMLLDTPIQRIYLLKKVSKSFRIFLLSNTNEIHIPVFYQNLKKEIGISDFEGIFEKVYLSYLINMRKPDFEIYNTVLQDNNLIATETLFIDDLEKNIEGAQKAGLNVLHLNNGSSILELFE